MFSLFKRQFCCDILKLPCPQNITFLPTPLVIKTTVESFLPHLANCQETSIA